MRRAWHADRGRLLLRTPGPVLLGLAYVLLVEVNPFSELVVIFTDYATRKLTRVNIGEYWHNITENVLPTDEQRVEHLNLKLNSRLPLGDDHLILRGLALFGNKYSELKNAGNK